MPPGSRSIARHRSFRFPFQPDGLGIIGERIADDAILDRIGEMDTGDIIVP